VDAPIGVDHLGHPEIDRNRHQRDRFVLGEPLGGHQKMPHLAECVAHRPVERGFAEDLGLRLVAELRQVIRKAKAVHNPFVRRLQKRVVEIGEWGSGQAVPLVKDQLEGAGQRAFDRGAAQLRIALAGMRIAD
jgi:hypothetical protein